MSITMQMRHKVELNAPLITRNLPGVLQEGDTDANAFVLEVTQDEKPFDLSGYTPSGYLIRGDGNSVLLEGTVANNIATIPLSPACYRVPGFFAAFVRLTNVDGVSRTVLKVTGTVAEENLGGIVDDENILPSIDELLAKLDAMEAAREEAMAAAQTANEAAENLEAFKGEVRGEINRFAVEIKTKAPAIECEASGNIVSVSDSAAQSAVQLITHIEPVQAGSGDPSPDNVRPISGWDKVSAYAAGRNLVDLKMVLENAGVAYTQDGNAFTFNTTSSLYNKPFDFGQTLDVVSLSALITDNTTANVRVELLDESRKNVGNINSVNNVFSGATNARYMRLNWSASGNVTISDLCVEFGRTVEFEPAHVTLLTAELPETVYGGTLDWITGRLKKRAKKITADIKFGYQSGYSKGGTSVFSIRLSDASHKDRALAVCSHFPVTAKNPQSESVECCGFHPDEQYKDYFYVRIKDERLESVDDAGFMAWLANQPDFAMVYYSDEAEEFQLDPQQLDTLKGTNNIWSDCGDTSVVYVADTKLYIDKKIAAIAAASL